MPKKTEQSNEQPKNQSETESQSPSEPEVESEPETEPKAQKKSSPKKEDKEDILDDILSDLKEEVGSDLDLSYLSKKDQIKTLRQIKKSQKAAPEPENDAEEEEEKPKPKNPAVPDAPAAPKFMTIMEKNKVGGAWYKENIEDRQGLRVYSGKSK